MEETCQKHTTVSQRSRASVSRLGGSRDAERLQRYRELGTSEGEDQRSEMEFLLRVTRGFPVVMTELEDPDSGDNSGGCRGQATIILNLVQFLSSDIFLDSF